MASDRDYRSDNFPTLFRTPVDDISVTTLDILNKKNTQSLFLLSNIEFSWQSVEESSHPTGSRQVFPSMKQHYIRSQQQISFVKEMFSRQLAQQLGLMEVQTPS